MRTRNSALDVMLWLLERQARGEGEKLSLRKKFYLFELEREEELKPQERAWMARLAGMMWDTPAVKWEMRRVLRLMRRGIRSS